ncbi:hypothetical protein A0J61_10931 [Choanephora cucurbitarum]|uniref:Uncharacterized protein n=1 Tax=Choanephora cucurbitarum TaxID=101091 RepID=A0A1C7MW04_9FUNG|nr:hypothetical protein A0J61_10931 [Choanephora cucurbitarum]
MLYSSLFLLHVDTRSSSSMIYVTSVAYHLNASFKYLISQMCSKMLLLYLFINIEYEYFVLLPDQFTSLILDKMISFIQATMKAIGYSRFESVDHLIQLYMSTDSVKSYEMICLFTVLL